MESNNSSNSSNMMISTDAIQEHKTNTNIYTYIRENLIREGDIVVVFEGADNMKQLTMKRGEKFQNKFGCYNHDDIIDQYEYGSKIFSKNMKGYVHFLRPNSHMYTTSLSQRT